MDTQMSDAPHVQNPLDLKDLYAAFGAADSIVLKKYISKLSAAPCIELSDELKSIAIGENISLYQVSKIIYDKNENTQDKLTTVYSTIFSLQNYGLAMLLNGNKDHVDLYLGVVTRNLLMRQKSPEEVLNEDNMTTLRNSEKTIAGGGSGFRFNGEGNQVSYRCDATQVTTIDFDRNKIRGMATALSKKADEISMALDKCLVNTEVAYEAPFDINDSFEEILNDFIEKAAVA